MKMSRFFGAVLFGVLCISGVQVYAQSVPAPTYVISQPFPRNLSIGMRGEDVQRLQQFLNTHGSPVASNGPGSAGKETQLYGSATRAAVAAFQKMRGITPAVGYFGPITRAKVLEMLSTSGGASVAGAPSVVSKVDTSGSRAWVDISWQPSNGATSYTIERQTGGGDFVVVGSTQKTSYQDRAVENFVTYYYRIIATNVSGSSKPSYSVLGKIGNNGGGSGVAITTDNSAPSLSNGSPSGTLTLGTTSATLAVDTDEIAECRYDTSSGSTFGLMTPFDTTNSTSHSAAISGLSNGESYIYYVKCQDAHGNTTASDYTISFTVAADLTSPTVSITSPSNNATVSGASVSLAASASDDVGVVGVQFKLDGSNYGAEDTVAPYAITFDTTATTDGSHTLTAVARDAGGNSTTSAVITVTVDNTAPTISSISATPSTTSASISWSTNESSDSQVEYGTTSSYGTSTTLDSSMVTSHVVALSGLSLNTTYHYRVRSSDAAGNVRYSTDQTFTTSSVMPSGTIGLWYIDQYNASSRQVIANSASATPVSTNLFGASRRMFTNSDWWTYSSATVTDLAATAPDGSNDATTVNGTGNWYVRPISGATLPAGTYTLAVNAKRNTSSDQQFAFYRSNTAVRSTAKTATSTWQRFTYTFTLSTSSQFSQIGLGSIDGSTAGNIQIADFELYSGSSDLGPQTYAGHLYVGVNSGDTRPTYASGELNMSSTGVGLIQYPTTQTLTTFTAQALVSHTAANNAYSSYLSKVQSYSSFSAMSESAGIPASIIGGSSVITPTQNSGLWATSTKGYHTFTIRYDGTATDYWVDDILLFHKVGALSATTLTDVYVNITNTFTLYGKLKYAGAIALWDRALSDSEVRQSVAYQQSRAASSSITSTSATRVLVAGGDSITGGFTYSYPYKLGTNASPELFGANYAISNSTISSMVSRASTVDGILPPNRTGRTFILSVLIGANDLQSGYSGPGGSGLNGWLADLATYLDARRAAGWKVALGTVLPRSAAGFNTIRNSANTILRTWVGTHADAIFDFAADATMGTDAAASNTTYYADGTHPTNAGQAILEPIYRATINSM